MNQPYLLLLQESDGGSVVDKLFGMRMETKLKCEESGEEINEASTAYSLKCNIAGDTNYLHQVGARWSGRLVVCVGGGVHV